VNSRGGVFCKIHQNEFGSRCHVRECLNPKVAGTKKHLTGKNLG